MIQPPTTPSVDDGTYAGLDDLYTETITVTPVEAQRILKTLNWERQRAIQERWVEKLARAMVKGELFHLALVFAERPDGSRVLLDGQHRLRAMIEADRTFRNTAVTVHRIMDDSQLGPLYLTYDRSRVRGPDVGLKAMGAFDEIENKDMPESFVKRLSAAVVIVDSGFSRSYKWELSNMDRSYAVRGWMREIEAYFDLLRDSPSSSRTRLIRSPVAAVALATLRYQPAVAREFWRRTATQEMLREDDPRRRLMIFLEQRRITKIEGNEIAYAQHVAVAWNAFFEGRTLKLIRINDTSGYVNIVGTNYTTRRPTRPPLPAPRPMRDDLM